MKRNPAGNEDSGRAKRGMPLWFKLFVVALIGLIISKLLGLQVFVEISYDGEPFVAALTDARTYFLPLVLILLYILLRWAWGKVFRARNSR